MALIALGLVLFVLLAATAKHRGWLAPRSSVAALPPPATPGSGAPANVPNAAQPESQLPGAVAQAEAQAKLWGPGGGPPVIIPDDTTAIKLLRPVTRKRSGDAPEARPNAVGAALADMVAFDAPAEGTMTPCGNDMARTSFTYRHHMEVESLRNFLHWECRYLPTGSHAESKVEIDCEKRMVAPSSTVFFRGSTRLTEILAREEMHPPAPKSLEQQLLTLACALPQPSANELGKPSGSAPTQAELLARVDSCFALAVPRLPASTPFAPRGLGAEDAAVEILAACRGITYLSALRCLRAGGTEGGCMESIRQRARAAVLNPATPSTHRFSH